MKFLIILIILAGCKGEIQVNGNYFPNEYVDFLNIGDLSTIQTSSSVISGETYSVIVSTYSSRGEKINRGGAKISLIYEGLGSIEIIETIDNQDGTYLIKYKPIKAGSGKLFLVGNKLKTNSFQFITISPNVLSLNDSDFFISKNNFLEQDQGVAFFVPRDLNKNKTYSNSLSIRPIFTDGSAQASVSNFVYNSNGYWTGDIVATQTGSAIKLNLSITNYGVISSKNSMIVDSISFDYSKSSLYLPKNQIKVNEQIQLSIFIKNLSNSIVFVPNLPIFIETYNGTSVVDIEKIEQSGSFYIATIRGISAGSKIKIKPMIEGLYILQSNELEIQVIP